MALGLGPISAQAVAARAGRPPPAEILSLYLTGAWFDDYPGNGEWPGTLSLGESGSRPLVGTLPSASGTLINGYTAANFGLITNDVNVQGELGQLIAGGSGWSFGMVLKPSTIVADAGARTNEPALWSAFSGYSGVALSDAGAGVWQYDGGGSYVDALASGATVGTTCFIQARWTGTAIDVRVDNGTWGTSAISSRLTVNDDDPAIIGHDFGGSLHLDADVVGFFFAREAFDDTTFDAIYSALSTRYGFAGATNYTLTAVGASILAALGIGSRTSAATVPAPSADPSTMLGVAALTSSATVQAPPADPSTFAGVPSVTSAASVTAPPADTSSTVGAAFVVPGSVTVGAVGVGSPWLGVSPVFSAYQVYQGAPASTGFLGVPSVASSATATGVGAMAGVGGIAARLGSNTVASPAAAAGVVPPATWTGSNTVASPGAVASVAGVPSRTSASTVSIPSAVAASLPGLPSLVATNAVVSPGILGPVAGAAAVAPGAVTVGGPGAFAGFLGVDSFVLTIPSTALFAPSALALAGLGQGAVAPGAITVQLVGAVAGSAGVPARSSANTVAGVAPSAGAPGAASVLSAATVVGTGASAARLGLPSVTSASTFGAPGALSGRLGSAAVLGALTVAAPGAMAGVGGIDAALSTVAITAPGVPVQVASAPFTWYLLPGQTVFAPGAMAVHAGYGAFGFPVFPAAIFIGHRPSTKIEVSLTEGSNIVVRLSRTAITLEHSMIYDVGDDAVVTATFRVANVPTNPTTLAVDIWPPGSDLTLAAPTTVTYPSASLTTTGTGVFRLVIDCTSAGTWHGSWRGTGAAKGAEPFSFIVRGVPA